MPRKFAPNQGKWTLKRLVRREINYHGGEMPLEALLTRMSLQGYLRKPLLEKLDLLDVDVTDGIARLRYG